MAYDLMIGRDEADRQKFGKKGLVFLGKSYVQMGHTTSLSNNLYLDVSRSHVVLVCGKRGSGKSYSLSVLTEEIASMPEEVKQNIAVLIFDTMGIFWTMKYPNTRQDKLLKQWGMKPEAIDVDIYTPSGYYKEYKEKNIPTDFSFAIKTSDLKAGDWAGVFEIKLTDPIGVLIEKALITLKDRESYSVMDIIEEIKADAEIEKSVKNAAINRFIAAEAWGLFDEYGSTIDDIVKAGRVSILDVSCYTNVSGSWGIKNLVIGYLCGKLLTSRITTRKLEEREAIETEGKFFSTKKKKDLPLTWVLIDECLPGDSQVETDKGKISLKKLVEKVDNGGIIKVLSHNSKTKKLEYKKITKTFKIKEKELLELKTETGEILRCTADHPILTSRGYVYSAEAENVMRPLILPYSTKKKIIISRLLGHILGDGYLSKNQVVGFSGKGCEEDLLKIKEDMKRLGFGTSNIYTRITKSKITDIDGKTSKVIGISQEMTTSIKAWKFFEKYGLPKGKKTDSKLFIPEFIKNASKNEKREFLAALLASDGFGLTSANNSKLDFNALRVSFNKLESLEKEAWNSAFELRKLFEDVGITVSSIKRKKGNIRTDGKKTIKIVLTISKNINNMILFLETVSFRYNRKKELGAAKLLRYLKAYKAKLEDYKVQMNQVLSLKKDHTLKEISTNMNVPYSRVRMWSKGKTRGKFTYDFQSFEEWITERVKDGLLHEKIISKKIINPEPLFDITVEDNHNFIADGFIVHNCHEALPKEGKTPATDALVQLLREGRQPGISLILATQQPGEIHRDVLTQTDIVLAHKLTATRDIEALNSMMQGYLLEGISKQLNELPDLKGSAIILDDNSERIYPLRVHPKKSWHGGSTPSAIKVERDVFQLDL